MAVKFANNVSTTLSAAINATQTTISVADASGLPTLSSGDYVYLTIDTDTDSPTREVVKVTAVSSNDLTVVRGQDDTTASSFSSGTKVELRVTAASLSDISSAADTESVSIAGDTMTGNLTVPSLNSGGITTSSHIDFTATTSLLRNQQDNSGQIGIQVKNSGGTIREVRWDAANNTNGAWRPTSNGGADLGITNKIWNNLFVNTIKMGTGNVEVIDSARNGSFANLTVSGSTTSGPIVATGTGTTSTTNALRVARGNNASAFTVRDDGVVLVQQSYLYVNNTAGMYSLGAFRARGGITNDGGNPLSINSGASHINFNNKNLESVGNVQATRYRIGTTDVIDSSRHFGANVAPNASYAINALQNGSLTRAAYFQANGGSGTGLEINATAGTYSGDALYVRQSTVSSGGNLARFANSSGDKFTVTTAGNVGIGTSSIGSSTKLQVAGRGLFTDGLPDPGDGSPAGVAIGYTSGYGFIQAIQTGVANKPLRIQPNGTDHIILGAGGAFVGIGTIAPNAVLETVSPTSGGAPVFRAGTADFLGVQIGTTGGGFSLESNNYFAIWHQPYANKGTQTNLTERFHISSGGNVGINTGGNTPEQTLSVMGNFHVGLNTSVTGRGLKVSTSNDQITDDLVTLNAQAVTGVLRFDTAGTEAGRFDASQNFLVGTTNTVPGVGNTTTGISLYNDGRIFVSKSGNAVMSLNRNTNDGNVLEVRKTGNSVGSLGVKSSDLFIGTGDTGVRFVDGDDALIPHSVTANDYRDAGVDLGHSSFRFKDLHMSGSAFIATTRLGNGSQASPSHSFFADFDTGMFRATTNQLGFSTAGVERGRFDGSGNLLIGTTSDNVANQTGTTQGVRIAGAQNIQVASTGTAAYFNRLSTNGTIVEFRRAGTAVGSIGVAGGDLTIGTGDTGLTFEDAVNVIHPINVGTGAARDDSIDLGKSAAQFKDLYLSGSAYANQTILSSGNVKSDNVFQFLTTGNAAQNIRTRSVFAGTSYSDVPPAGSFNATNTYELNGTTVIDSSRNLTNISSITAAGVLQVTNSSGSNGTTTSQYAVIGMASGGAQATIGAHHSGDNYANLNLSSVVGGDRKMWHISKRTNSLDNRLEFFWYESGGFNSRFQFSTGGNFTASGSLIGVNAIVDNVLAKTSSGNILFKTNAGASIARFNNNLSADFFGNISVNGTSTVNLSGSPSTDYLDFDDDSTSYTTGTNATVLASKSDVAIRTNTNDGGGGRFTVTTGNSSPSNMLVIESNGLIQIGNAGSASSPTIQSLIDPDTGIFFGGGNILGFSAGGSERGRFNASGLNVTGNIVGAGINSTANFTELGSTSSSSLVFKRNDASYLQADSSGGYFIFITSGRSTSYANRALAITTDNHLKAGGHVDAVSGFLVNGTTVIDNGRNLLSIGSISASTITTSGDITVSGNQVFMNASNARAKFCVWSNNTYGIGMTNGVSFGGIGAGSSDYAMTFQMSNTSSRGFVWLDTAHNLAQGAMALTTNGKLTVANAVRIGFGESDTTAPDPNTAMLQVNGDILLGTTTTDARLVIQKADNNVPDHIKIFCGSTQTGEIGSMDTTWLRINQSIAKNIYTPRYIRADSGFFVDNTATGLDGSGRLRAFAGSTSSVGIGFANDIDTGFYRPSANTIDVVTAGDAHARFDSTGNLIVEGNVTAFGSVSDIRLKENIERIADPVEKVKQLDGVTFNYKKTGVKSTGLIAQQLLEVLPEVVYEETDIESGESHYALRYGQVVGLLVEAIKEQQDQIDSLKSIIEEMRNGNN